MMFIGWLLIAAVIYFVFTNSGATLPKVSSKSPKEVLDERFVNGEIDEQTYARMKSALEDR